MSTWVREATEEDWEKLLKILLYIKATRNEFPTLEADDDQIIRWHVDASYAYYNDMKSHTGALMSIGKGMISLYPRKRNVNTRSSTESEMVGVDDMMRKIL